MHRETLFLYTQSKFSNKLLLVPTQHEQTLAKFLMFKVALLVSSTVATNFV